MGQKFFRIIRVEKGKAQSITGDDIITYDSLITAAILFFEENQERLEDFREMHKRKTTVVLKPLSTNTDKIIFIIDNDYNHYAFTGDDYLMYKETIEKVLCYYDKKGNDLTKFKQINWTQIKPKQKNSQ